MWSDEVIQYVALPLALLILAKLCVRTKLEPIMLSVLPIIPPMIFIPMPSPIIPVIFFKFLLCQ